MRDDFPEGVKRSLALRVGSRCSRAECGALTSGPQDEPSKAINVGVAAHIAAAAAGGPRYDPFMSAEERTSAANGIWLCQNCAKLVDNDPVRFTIEVLQRWKIEREAEARRAIGLSNHQAGAEPARLLVRFAVGKHVQEGWPDEIKFVFTVSNPSTRPISVWGAGVEAPTAGVSVPVVRPEIGTFPHHLTDGQGFMFLSPVSYFESELHRKGVDTPIQIVGYVTDALGRTHKSEPVRYPEESFKI